MACILAILACSAGNQEDSAASAMPALTRLVQAVSHRASSTAAASSDLADDLSSRSRPINALSGLVSLLKVRPQRQCKNSAVMLL